MNDAQLSLPVRAPDPVDVARAELNRVRLIWILAMKDDGLIVNPNGSYSPVRYADPTLAPKTTEAQRDATFHAVCRAGEDYFAAQRA